MSDLTPEQERMQKAVAILKEYIGTYDQQPHYRYYSDSTFINDVLYGLGIALHGERAWYANGFEWFKGELRKHLEEGS